MNNAGIYDAVLAGVAGSTQAITSQSTPAIIALFADHADDLANAVDALIPTVSGGISPSRSSLMSQIVAGLIFNRFLGDFIAPSTGFGTTPSIPNYAAIAQVIVTLYNAMSTWLVDSPNITAPLNAVWYVDQSNGLPSSLRNGSISSPYRTISEAITAHPGVSATIIIAPGDYTMYGNVTIPAANEFAIVGMNSLMQWDNPVVPTQPVMLANLLMPALSAAARLTLANIRVEGGITVNNATVLQLDLINAFVGTIVAKEATICASNSTIATSCDCSAITADGCTFGNPFALNMTYTAAVPLVKITRCCQGAVTVNYPVGPATDVRVDPWSYGYIAAVNNGNLVTQGLPTYTMTGTTVQQQLDSIAAGLVATLHWTDSRTP